MSTINAGNNYGLWTPPQKQPVVTPSSSTTTVNTVGTDDKTAPLTPTTTSSTTSTAPVDDTSKTPAHVSKDQRASQGITDEIAKNAKEKGKESYYKNGYLDVRNASGETKRMLRSGHEVKDGKVVKSDGIMNKLARNSGKTKLAALGVLLGGGGYALWQHHKKKQEQQ